MRSALQTVNSAAMAILAGFGDTYIAGGCESWSNAPYLMERQKVPFSLTPNAFITKEVGPTPETNAPMGIVAEILAEEWGISREEQDAFGLRSQTLAIKAIEAGYFKDEIVPVTIPRGRAIPSSSTGTSIPGDDAGEAGIAQARLQEGRNGHCRQLLGHERRRRGPPAHGEGKMRIPGAQAPGPLRHLRPRRRGAEYMGIGPAYAIPKALDRAGLKLADMDIVECNEAFASQTLAS